MTPKLHIADDAQRTNGNGPNGVRRVTDIVQGRHPMFLCGKRGKPARPRTRRKPAREADRYMWLTSATFGQIADACGACRRLALMPADERTAMIRARDAKRDDAFAAMKLKRDDARIAELEEIRASVATAREDAQAALDVWEDGRHFLKIGEPIPNRPKETSKLDTAAILMMAIVAYQLEHPSSGGSNLYVLAKLSRGLGDLVCRFCREVLVSGAELGIDYAKYPTVHDHTVTCGLRFLVGIARHADGCTDPDDEHADCDFPCGLVGCDPIARKAAS